MNENCFNWIQYTFKEFPFSLLLCAFFFFTFPILFMDFFCKYLLKCFNVWNEKQNDNNNERIQLTIKMFVCIHKLLCSTVQFMFFVKMKKKCLCIEQMIAWNASFTLLKINKSQKYYTIFAKKKIDERNKKRKKERTKKLFIWDCHQRYFGFIFSCSLWFPFRSVFRSFRENCFSANQFPQRWKTFFNDNGKKERARKIWTQFVYSCI